MKILIVGYGSIGKRHAKNCANLGHKAILLRHSRNNINRDNFREYYSLDGALRSEKKIHGAIVCSPTSRHLNDVKMLIERNIPFLLEKPPAADLKSVLLMQKLINAGGFFDYDIAFNLRHHPILKFIKNFLPKLGSVFSVRVYADYYLPNWRKGIDYRQTTSAKKELGGGVLLELVHEIDYILWFFGYPQRVFACIRKISGLEISSKDLCCAVFEYEKGPLVELHLGYISHKYLRGCQIIAENGTLEWDFNQAGVYFTGKGKKKSKEIFSLIQNYNFNDTYISELKAFISIIHKRSKTKVRMQEGVMIMRVIEAMRNSTKYGRFVSLKNMPLAEVAQ